MDYTRLSKTISHALRHDPWRYGLELDEEGWTPVEALLETLREERREWGNLQAGDLQRMMEQSTKQRFELREGKIRAFYGHSVPQRVRKVPATPPPLLYHGTPPDAAALILREGLRPMRRQYVHLSADIETARIVGSRRSGKPVILTILAAEAQKAGVPFYLGNETVWLADLVPPEFIRNEQAG